MSTTKDYPFERTTNFADILKQETKKIVLVCNSGATAKSLAKKLKEQGMDVFILQGGITEWLTNNLPMVKK